MKAKFIVYAILVSLVCTVLSWASMISPSASGNHSGGSAWSANSGGGSWGGGGGHK